MRLADGQRLDLAGGVRVIFTPGHTPGHIALYLERSRTLIAGDALRAGHSCKGLIREVPGYAWDDKAAKLGEDAPIKIDDHGLDALRYAIKTTHKLWHYSIYGGVA